MFSSDIVYIDVKMSSADSCPRFLFVISILFISFCLQNVIPAEANFTDLAELISRIDDPKDNVVTASQCDSANIYVSEGGTGE